MYSSVKFRALVAMAVLGTGLVLISGCGLVDGLIGAGDDALDVDDGDVGESIPDAGVPDSNVGEPVPQPDAGEPDLDAEQPNPDATDPEEDAEPSDPDADDPQEDAASDSGPTDTSEPEDADADSGVEYDCAPDLVPCGAESCCEWIIEDVDTERRTGDDNAIAVDSDDGPHISHYNWQEDSNSEDRQLRYSYRTGPNQWEQEIVHETSSYWDTSIQIDSDDRSHICYGNAVGREVVYASVNEGSWDIEVVDDEEVNYPGSNPTLDIDADDRLHLSYRGTDNAVRYARQTDNVWERETVAVNDGFGWAPSLALGPEGNPNIVYFDSETDNLTVARYDSGDWIFEIYDDPDDEGEDPVLAVDDENRLHVTYSEWIGSELRYAHFDGDQWHVEVIEDIGTLSHESSLALDADGTPHVAYRDSENNDLHYAWRSEDGWVTMLVDTGGSVKVEPSIAIDSNGRPHIAYRAAPNGGLGYATLQSP